MFGSYARRAFPLVAALWVACCVIQVFLAGLGVFDGPSSFITHRDFGYTFSLLILVLLVLAIVGRMSRAIVGGCVPLAVLFTLQSVFVALRTDMPTLAALHPLNGFLILGVGVFLTRASWAGRDAESATPPRPARSASPRRGS
jgi:uncharacterized protein DUF6220